VMRTFTFPAFTTNQIQVNITHSLSPAYPYSRVVEVQAWGVNASNLPATTTTVVSSANPASFGASVTFTATVSGTAGPTGSVQFTTGGGTISGCGAVTLAGGGNSPTAACTTSSLAAGTHSIVATYAGDGANAGSTSTALSQVINAPAPAPTTTTLASSANPASSGVGVTFTATVSGSAAPTGSVDFTAGGSAIAGCAAVALTGGGNSPSAACTTSSLAVGPNTIVATYGGNAGNTGSTSTALTETITAAPTPVNVALASAGAVASASSTYGPGYPASAVNDGDVTGANWGNGGGWNDATPGVWPDWVQIAFNGEKTLTSIVVYTLQDDYQNPVVPTPSMTFSDWGITDFTVQGWNGSSWVVLGSATGNNLVMRTFTFPAFTTNQIQVNITHSLSPAYPYSRVVELQAWGN